METAALSIRRGRRQDFGGVMSLLAEAGVGAPAADRATLRRFRHIVADLGSDFYVAEMNGNAIGFVYVTYARQLAGAQLARIEHLLVAEPYRARGVEHELLAFASARARKRACADLRCVPAPGTVSPAVAERGALVADGAEYRVRLQQGD